MNILLLAYSDTAGSPGAWARALTGLGHRVTVLFEARHKFGYAEPKVHAIHYVRWSNGNKPVDVRIGPIRELARGHDVALAVDHPYYYAAAGHLGLSAHFHGFGTAAHDGWGDPAPPAPPAGVTGDTLELCASGFDWLPMPVWGQPSRRTDSATVYHAPTAPELKGTALVVAACGEAGLVLDLPDRVLQHSRAIARMRSAGVIVDQVFDGQNDRCNAYGVSGLEAFAMGIPVVGSPSPSVEPFHARHLGPPDARPYALVRGTEPADVAAAIAAARGDTERVEAAREYIATAHDPARCARAMAERLEAACR